jgi:hypothetical protein
MVVSVIMRCDVLLSFFLSRLLFAYYQSCTPILMSASANFAIPSVLAFDHSSMGVLVSEIKSLVA